MKPETENNGNKPKGLYARIIEAQRAITHIHPNQTVTDGPTKGHKYASKADVFCQIKSAIHDAGLAVISSMSNCTTQLMELPDRDGHPVGHILTVVTMSFGIVDAETGEKEIVTSHAISIDRSSQGDYAAQAAATSAIRQFYCDTFQVPVMEESGGIIPPATEEQKNQIKKLYAEVTIDRDTWGHMIGMSPAEFRTPEEEEFKQNFAQYWSEMKVERAASIIAQLDIIKLLQTKLAPKGTGKPNTSIGGRPDGR